ncbi:hypothetical protein BCR34DRAFT_585616 [Clohesyomyces aquaticus]|uniref:Uncharacterized protein n=1 Tax=Clohesyomyces aquaticus TaxID=1231657 RepID=A0A1Y1ZWJ4_9PLEO|nr:hypothetical protein BCR34DRAFT_585616 [Clohesyomyces aquaticus]
MARLNPLSRAAMTPPFKTPSFVMTLKIAALAKAYAALQNCISYKVSKSFAIVSKKRHPRQSWPTPSVIATAFYPPHLFPKKNQLLLPWYGMGTELAKGEKWSVKERNIRILLILDRRFCLEVPKSIFSPSSPIVLPEVSFGSPLNRSTTKLFMMVYGILLGTSEARRQLAQHISLFEAPPRRLIVGRYIKRYGNTTPPHEVPNPYDHNQAVIVFLSGLFYQSIYKEPLVRGMTLELPQGLVGTGLPRRISAEDIHWEPVEWDCNHKMSLRRAHAHLVRRTVKYYEAIYEEKVEEAKKLPKVVPVPIKPGEEFDILLGDNYFAHEHFQKGWKTHCLKHMTLPEKSDIIKIQQKANRLWKTTERVYLSEMTAAGWAREAMVEKQWMEDAIIPGQVSMNFSPLNTVEQAEYDNSLEGDCIDTGISATVLAMFGSDDEENSTSGSSTHTIDQGPRLDFPLGWIKAPDGLSSHHDYSYGTAEQVPGEKLQHKGMEHDGRVRTPPGLPSRQRGKFTFHAQAPILEELIQPHAVKHFTAGETQSKLLELASQAYPQPNGVSVSPISGKQQARRTPLPYALPMYARPGEKYNFVFGKKGLEEDHWQRPHGYC